jgi:hypothetical protein
MEAKWAGPLSFVTKISLRVYSASTCRRVVFPASAITRLEPTSFASWLLGAA